MSKARTRRKRGEELDEVVRGAPASPVLQLQQLAGNRAVTSLMRQPTKAPPKRTLKEVEPKAAPAPQMSDKAASDDLAFALKYVDDFYEGVRDVLELKDKVRENAIRAYTDFGKLKDPPSIADAVLMSLAESALGLIPGGNIIKMGLTAGIFALDMRALKKDLDVMPIVGMSAEDEKKKGPQTAHKEKAGKYYDRGKTVVDARRRRGQGREGGQGEGRGGRGRGGRGQGARRPAQRARDRLDEGDRRQPDAGEQGHRVAAQGRHRAASAAGSRQRSGSGSARSPRSARSSRTSSARPTSSSSTGPSTRAPSGSRPRRTTGRATGTTD